LGEHSLAVGIDLGTTFSSVSIVNDNGDPEILVNAEGERLTPSAVFFDEESIVIGELAKYNSTIHPNEVIQFVKREMGNGDFYVKHHGRKLSPIDISALILKKLKQDSETLLGDEIRYAVLTVPAYFDEKHRRATEQAGEIAGFKVLNLINEPTAAAIAFGVLKSEVDETVLVYDLGGGTFDATLVWVERKGETIRILSTDGDSRLGGKDFDDAIIRKCVDKFKSEHNFDPSEDAAESQQLRLDAEKAKKELSARPKTTILVRAGGLRSQVTITRDEFNEAIKPKIDTTLALVRSVLRMAKVQPSEVDRILMIGGSTRIPIVREMVSGMFTKEVDVSINPDEAVSLGASIMAAKEVAKIPNESIPSSVEEKIGGINITDVVSHSIGIEASAPGTMQKINSILIKKNSPIPCEVSKEFVTSIPGQTAVKLTVFQGEFQNPSLCNPIGDFFMTGLPPNRPPGKRVRVTVACTANGTVQITAKDIESGAETNTHVNYAFNDSGSQVSAKKLWMESLAIE
jgi:molecular chaperone DnaK